jgi:hypothetical protein
MKKIILTSLFLALAAYGQQTQRIAIMGTEDDGEPPIKILEQVHLTDKLREVAGDILPKSLYTIMTQQSIVDMLGSQEQAAKICREAICLADLGRKVNADYIAQARIGRFGKNLTIKIELYRVGNSSLIASFASNSKDVQGLLEILEAKAPALFKKMPGVSGDEPAPLPPAPPPPPPPPLPPPPVAEPALEPEPEPVTVVEPVPTPAPAPAPINSISTNIAKESASEGETFWSKNKNIIRGALLGLAAASTGIAIYQSGVAGDKRDDMKKTFYDAESAYIVSDPEAYNLKKAQYDKEKSDLRNAENTRNGFYISAGLFGVAGVACFFF